MRRWNYKRKVDVNFLDGRWFIVVGFKEDILWVRGVFLCVKLLSFGGWCVIRYRLF